MKYFHRNPDLKLIVLNALRFCMMRAVFFNMSMKFTEFKTQSVVSKYYFSLFEIILIKIFIKLYFKTTLYLRIKFMTIS